MRETYQEVFDNMGRNESPAFQRGMRSAQAWCEANLPRLDVLEAREAMDNKTLGLLLEENDQLRVDLGRATKKRSEAEENVLHLGEMNTALTSEIESKTRKLNDHKTAWLRDAFLQAFLVHGQSVWGYTETLRDLYNDAPAWHDMPPREREGDSCSTCGENEWKISKIRRDSFA